MGVASGIVREARMAKRMELVQVSDNSKVFLTYFENYEVLSGNKG